MRHGALGHSGQNEAGMRFVQGSQRESAAADSVEGSEACSASLQPIMSDYWAEVLQGG